MGEVIDRLRRLRDESGTFAGVTVLSLQDSGVTRYSAGGASGNGRGLVDLSLNELFSDRTFDRGDTPPVMDPSSFDTKQADSSTLILDVNGPTATMVLHSWGDATFSFSVQDQGDVLFGVGDPAGPSFQSRLLPHHRG